MQARRGRLDSAIEDMAADSEFTPIVRRVSCLRGVSTLTGFALAVEIGDWNRFTGNTIGSFVGLTPSEYSSGSSRVQGSITKTGNTHVRRLLVEAAWHHRPRYHVGAVMRVAVGPGLGSCPRPRGRGQPPPARQVGGFPGTPQAARQWPTSRSPASLPAGAGRWRSWTTDRHLICFLSSPVVAARGSTRDTTMSRPSGRRSTLDKRMRSSRNPVLR